jgi:hypothetical protein
MLQNLSIGAIITDLCCLAQPVQAEFSQSTPKDVEKAHVRDDSLLRGLAAQKAASAKSPGAMPSSFKKISDINLTSIGI